MSLEQPECIKCGQSSCDCFVVTDQQELIDSLRADIAYQKKLDRTFFEILEVEKVERLLSIIEELQKEKAETRTLRMKHEILQAKFDFCVDDGEGMLVPQMKDEGMWKDEWDEYED